MVPSATLASNAWLKKLSKEQVAFVKSTASDLSQWVNDRGIEYGKKAEQTWRDNGAEVIRLSDAEQKTFMDTVRPLGDEFLGTNPQTKDMFNLLKKAVERARM